MSPRYASGTEVTTSRSREEIERTVTRFGASQFLSGFDERVGAAMVAFVIHGRQVRFVLPMPDRNDPRFSRTETGRPRAAKAAAAAWEQAGREAWRALAVVIKAKLVAVESGIVSFEEEFAMHMVLPDGRTVADFVLPALDEAYAVGKMPNLLALNAPR